jgi:Tol biopolymer transport system component
MTFCIDTKTVYLHDRARGTTQAVVQPSKSTTNFTEIVAPRISADGQMIAFVLFGRAFVGTAPRLISAPGEQNEKGNLILLNRASGAVHRVSIGLPWPPGTLRIYDLSRDGSVVLFTDAGQRLVVLDRRTGARNVLTARSWSGVISGDGRRVAFVERNAWDGTSLYVFDRTTQRKRLIAESRRNVTTGESDGVIPFYAGMLSAFALSPDGRWLAFSSNNRTLEGNQSHDCTGFFGAPKRACYNVYLADAQTGDVQLITHGDGDSFVQAVSAQGRWVTLTSFAGNLTPDGPNTCPLYAGVNCPDVFVWDRSKREVRRLSAGSNVKIVAQVNTDAQVSADGQVAAFLSTYDNRATGAAGNLDFRSVYVYDLQARRLEPLLK